MLIPIKDAQVSGIWVTLYVCFEFLLITGMLNENIVSVIILKYTLREY